MNAIQISTRKPSIAARTLITLAIVASATGSFAAEWGTLTGRLVLDGTAPEAAAIKLTVDAEYCGQHKPVYETVVIGEKNGVTNAFIYLYLKKKETVKIHPDLEKPPADPVVLDNKGCRFEPHALLVRTGQELRVQSSDPIGHNTKVDLFKNIGFNQMLLEGEPLSKRFKKSESVPMAAVCSIHPWMECHILIRDNPYMAVTGKDGSFEIKNIPAGQHEFIFWHESMGKLKNISLGPGGKTDRKGKAKLKIPGGGKLELGDIKIEPASLGL